MGRAAFRTQEIPAIQTFGRGRIFLFSQATYIAGLTLDGVRILNAEYSIQIYVVLKPIYPSYRNNRLLVAFRAGEFVFRFVAIENCQQASRTQRMQTWQHLWSLQKLFADDTS